MAKSGERAVREYLESKGLRVIKIPESDFKTVDFEVHFKSARICYLEEKTIELTPPAWKDVDPVYNSIARHIYDAIKQFKSVNPERIVPNVLSLTSMDPGRRVDDLFTTLTGHVVSPTGKMRLIRKMQLMEDDLPLIDLYLWFDQDGLAGHIYDEYDYARVEKLLNLLGLEDL